MEYLAPTMRVAAGMKLRISRRLPVDGDILVDPGERVKTEDLVARASLRGEVIRLNLVDALGLRSGGDAARYLLKAPGDPVEAGENIARKAGRFGTGERVCASPISGTLASGPTMSGDILIAPHPHDIELQALLPGTIAGILPRRGVVVESFGARVQCVACIGGETQGKIKVAANDLGQSLDPEAIDESYSGAVLVAGDLGVPALRVALFVGVSAAIVGSISATTFRWLQDNPLPVTVVITEGFGSIPMARCTYDLFRSHAGYRACVFATNDCVFAINDNDNDVPGFSLPEVLIPTLPGRPDAAAPNRPLGVGSIVRVVRGRWVGARGRVADFPPRMQTLASGVRSEVVKVILDDGQPVTIGRGNIELVE